ncbi:MAG: hypothetical protein NTW32_20360 [Chloroflexi bacterium]|nr:hypothetical protein [Chloroflexota bacterium]
MRVRHALLLILILLTACSAGSPAAGELTSTPAPSATPLPTAGPTPTPAPPLVILVVPVDMNETQSKAYQKAVYALAQAQSYRFIVLNKLTSAELEPALKVVIDLSPETDVAALAAGAPQAQFLAINLPGVQPGGNISILGGEKTSIDKVAFMAGYIGATITQDFHTGILVRKGSADADAITMGFRAGQQYFCGLCNPYTGPFEPYPLVQDIPQDAKPAEYGAYADILIRKKVDTMFIEQDIAIPELLQYLQTVGVLMIGTQTPSKAVNGWVVTLQPNYLEAMQAAFPELVAGQGGKAFPAPLTLNDANSNLFGKGKQANALNVLDNLLQGFISTEIK